MLVIEPGECIVCGLCVPECPEDAIVYATDPEGLPWAKLNAKNTARSGQISPPVKQPPKDAEKPSTVSAGKFKKYFDSAPGELNAPHAWPGGPAQKLSLLYFAASRRKCRSLKA